MYLCVCVLTCHTYNALVVNGTAREPGIGGAASQLGIVVLRSYLQREYARRDVGILQRKHNNDLLQNFQNKDTHYSSLSLSVHSLSVSLCPALYSVTTDAAQLFGNNRTKNKTGSIMSTHTHTHTISLSISSSLSPPSLPHPHSYALDHT